MKKIYAIVATMAIMFMVVGSFIACNDDKEEPNVGNEQIGSQKSLINIFNTKEFFDFSSEQLYYYIQSVSSETGVDIIALSQSQAIANMDSIDLPECFVEKLNNDAYPTSFWDTLNARYGRLKIALFYEDSVAAAPLAYWINEALECRTIITLDDLNNSAYLRNREMAIAIIDDIERDNPALTYLPQEAKQSIIALSRYYYTYTHKLRNKRDVQKCYEIRDIAIALATTNYLYELGQCMGVLIPQLKALCGLAATAGFALTWYAAERDLKKCLNN
ncbi:MAG: hypothetical protein LBO06_08060 [Bacteroidales bacterium]|jgi:hypothetical protein|nr:hypothetical protein [Bacteroidales bacterium]